MSWANRVANPSAPYFTDVSSLKVKPPVYLIDGLIEQGEIGVLFGKSGLGKTFIALDLALRVATGQPGWLRDSQGLVREITAGPVVYLLGEGTRSLSRRVRAWLLDNELDQHAIKGRFFARSGSVPLTSKAGQTRSADKVVKEESALGEFVNALCALPEPPRLLVIDPANFCLGGGNENDPDVVSQVFQSLRAIISRMFERIGTTLTVLIVHHVGKQEAHEPRGSSVWNTAADFEFRVFKGKDDQCTTLQHIKGRDVSSGSVWHFQVQGLPIGKDSLGRDFMSCVITAASRSDVSKNKTRRDEHAKKILQAIANGAHTHTAIRLAVGIAKSSLTDRLKPLIASGAIVLLGSKTKTTYALGTAPVRESPWPSEHVAEHGDSVRGASFDPEEATDRQEMADNYSSAWGELTDDAA